MKMICGHCEHEWNANGQREICPRCGCPDEFEDHVLVTAQQEKMNQKDGEETDRRDRERMKKRYSDWKEAR